MTQPIPDWNPPSVVPPPQASSSLNVKPDSTQLSAKREFQSLSYHDSYICPICRHGQIAELTLMDAFACSFCRHIFTANLQNQTVQVVDSAQPLSWRWTGRGWQSTHRDDPSLTAVVWFVSLVLVLLPGSIVGLMAYLFPPLPGSLWSWFPLVWLACTFGVHLLMVGWLIAEHYQIPLYVASRVRVRGWLDRG